MTTRLQRDCANGGQGSESEHHTASQRNRVLAPTKVLFQESTNTYTAPINGIKESYLPQCNDCINCFCVNGNKEENCKENSSEAVYNKQEEQDVVQSPTYINFSPLDKERENDEQEMEDRLYYQNLCTEVVSEIRNRNKGNDCDDSNFGQQEDMRTPEKTEFAFVHKNLTNKINKVFETPTAIARERYSAISPMKKQRQWEYDHEEQQQSSKEVQIESKELCEQDANEYEFLEHKYYYYENEYNKQEQSPELAWTFTSPSSETRLPGTPFVHDLSFRSDDLTQAWMQVKPNSSFETPCKDGSASTSSNTSGLHISMEEILRVCGLSESPSASAHKDNNSNNNGNVDAISSPLISKCEQNQLSNNMTAEQEGKSSINDLYNTNRTKSFDVTQLNKASLPVETQQPLFVQFNNYTSADGKFVNRIDGFVINTRKQKEGEELHLLQEQHQKEQQEVFNVDLSSQESVTVASQSEAAAAATITSTIAAENYHNADLNSYVNNNTAGICFNNLPVQNDSQQSCTVQPPWQEQEKMSWHTFQPSGHALQHCDNLENAPSSHNTTHINTIQNNSNNNYDSGDGVTANTSLVNYSKDEINNIKNSNKMSCIENDKTLPSCPSMNTLRRNHYMNNTKPAAGSLIAVGGRRVPVNKLYLLKPTETKNITDGPSARPLPVSRVRTITKPTITGNLHTTTTKTIKSDAPFTFSTAAAVNSTTVRAIAEELIHPSALPPPFSSSSSSSSCCTYSHFCPSATYSSNKIQQECPDVYSLTHSQVKENVDVCHSWRTSTTHKIPQPSTHSSLSSSTSVCPSERSLEASTPILPSYAIAQENNSNNNNGHPIHQFERSYSHEIEKREQEHLLTDESTAASAIIVAAPVKTMTDAAALPSNRCALDSILPTNHVIYNSNYVNEPNLESKHTTFDNLLSTTIPTTAAPAKVSPIFGLPSSTTALPATCSVTDINKKQNNDITYKSNKPGYVNVMSAMNNAKIDSTLQPSARPQPQRGVWRNVCASSKNDVEFGQTKFKSGVRNDMAISNNTTVHDSNTCKSNEYCEQFIATLRFSKGVVMHFTCNHHIQNTKGNEHGNEQGIKSMNSLERTLIHSTSQEVECVVGQSYLVHVYSHRSGCDGVAYEDVGVCVEYKTAFVQRDYNYTNLDNVNNKYIDNRESKLQFIDTVRGVAGVVDGYVVRRVDIVNNVLDAAQHHYILQRQSAAFEQCERELHILQRPVQLEAIHFTFDTKVCFLYYYCYPFNNNNNNSSKDDNSRMLSLSECQWEDIEHSTQFRKIICDLQNRWQCIVVSKRLS